MATGRPIWLFRECCDPMTAGQIVSLVLICLGGAALAAQAPINGALGRSLESPLAAAAVSFGVGFTALLLATLASAGAEPAGRLAGVPVWQFAGGLLGAFYVWSILSGVGSVGVLTALATLILGQLSAGLVLDHVGAFGLPVQPISATRIGAAVLIGAGLILSRL